MCAPLQPSVVSRPIERAAGDILGPLALTGEKNKYISRSGQKRSLFQIKR